MNKKKHYSFLACVKITLVWCSKNLPAFAWHESTATWRDGFTLNLFFQEGLSGQAGMVSANLAELLVSTLIKRHHCRWRYIKNYPRAIL
jgi:hypothetical protein